MENVQNTNGNYYGITGLGNSAMLAGSNTYSNPKLMQSYINAGLIRPLGAPSAPSTQTPSYQRPQFTPNAFTQGQLAGMGSGATPQWMMDAYTKKIGNMGGNANAPVPFNVTQSGFPGMGGKTAPAQGQ